MPKSLLSQQAEEIINKGISLELYASNLYLHLSNHCNRIGYFGASKFFKDESADEVTHYQKHADFMNDMGSVANIPSVPSMAEDIGYVQTLKDAVTHAYDLEFELFKQYSKMFQECNDPVVKQYLLQFLEIQRTSVGEFGDYLSMLDRAGDNAAAIIMVSDYMGED